MEPSTCIITEPPEGVTPAVVEAHVTTVHGTAVTMETLPQVSTGQSDADKTASESNDAPDLANHSTHKEAQGMGLSPPAKVKTRPIQDIKAPLSAITNLNQPYGVAINSKGEILMAELGAKCVSVFSPDGLKLRSFGEAGSGSGGKFRGCKRVAVDHEDNVLVTDHSHTIQRRLLCRVCR